MSTQPCASCQPSRRAVVTGVGAVAVAGAANPALTGCAGGGGAETVKAADVPVGGGTVVGSYVVTQPSEGEFKAFTKTCTHAGCAVSGVQGKVIVCDCHGSEFSTTDGSVVTGPATEPLAAAEVAVDGDSLSISGGKV